MSTPNSLGFTATKNSFPSGAVVCYYDFQQDGYDTHNRILSQTPARVQTSGQVIGSMPSFTGTIGSGNFEGNYVTIKNSSELFNPPTTFVFSLKKNEADAVTVFSNIENVDNVGSGYRFGLTPTHNLWFETWENNMPTTYCSNFSSVGTSNLWVVQANENTASLSVFDTSNTGLITNVFSLNPAFTERPSDRDCTLGTGGYGANYFLDYFVALSGSWGSSILTEVCQSAYQDYSYNDPVSGYLTGIQTGNFALSSPSGTGMIFKPVLSGYTGTTQSLLTTSGTPETGDDLISGQTVLFDKVTGSLSGFVSNYYIDDGLLGHPPNLLYSITISDGTEVGPQVTGFSGSGIAVDVDFSGAVYIQSGVTGFIFPTYLPSGMTGVSGRYLATSASSGIAGNVPTSYYLEDLTFMGTSGTGNDIGDYVLLPRGDLYNQTANLTNSNFGGSPASSLNFAFSAQESFIGTTGFSGMLEVGGITQYCGKPLNSLTALRVPQVTITGGDYYVTGSIMIFQQMINVSSYCLYDRENVKNRALEMITESGWTTSSVVSPDNAQVYMNGQKCYSGSNQDYKSVGGTLTLGGGSSSQDTDLSGVTGVLFGYDRYENSTEHTGLELLSIYDKSFPRNGFIFYLNGVRANLEDCIQYSSQTSLLTGVEIWRNTTQDIYNKIVV